MRKETITYVDYNGVERTEDFWFNFNKAELTEMELSVAGGLSATLEKISKTQDIPKIAEIFKKLILDSYGEKSDDGKRFIKDKEKTLAFSQTEAYVELYCKLARDAKAAADFINGIIPSDKEINSLSSSNNN